MEESLGVAGLPYSIVIYISVLSSVIGSKASNLVSSYLSISSRLSRSGIEPFFRLASKSGSSLDYGDAK